MTTQSRAHEGRMAALLRAGCLALVMTGIGAVPASGQAYTLDEAKSVFIDGNYSRATEMYSAIARDPNSSRDVKIQSYEFLGRAYLAQDMLDEAKAAIHEIVELPPPTERLNPDRVPPRLMDYYYEACEEADCFGENTYDGNIKTVAIVDFTDGSPPGPDGQDYGALGPGLSNMMITTLASGGIGLKIVERERTNWILDEVELQAENVTAETAVRIGKMIGAQSVIIGSFTVLGRDIWLGSRFVNVETSEVLQGRQVTGRYTDLFDLIGELTEQVAISVNATLDKASIDASKQTRSLDAMMSYSEGLALLDQESYTAAYNKFMQAYEYDSGYAQALIKAESIQEYVN